MRQAEAGYRAGGASSRWNWGRAPVAHAQPRWARLACHNLVTGETGEGGRSHPMWSCQHQRIVLQTPEAGPSHRHRHAAQLH